MKKTKHLKKLESPKSKKHLKDDDGEPKKPKPKLKPLDKKSKNKWQQDLFNDEDDDEFIPDGDFKMDFDDSFVDDDDDDF